MLEAAGRVEAELRAELERQRAHAHAMLAAHPTTRADADAGGVDGVSRAGAGAGAAGDAPASVGPQSVRQLQRDAVLLRLADRCDELTAEVTRLETALGLPARAAPEAAVALAAPPTKSGAMSAGDWERQAAEAALARDEWQWKHGVGERALASSRQEAAAAVARANALERDLLLLQHQTPLAAAEVAAQHARQLAAMQEQLSALTLARDQSRARCAAAEAASQQARDAHVGATQAAEQLRQTAREQVDAAQAQLRQHQDEARVFFLSIVTM